MVTTWQLQKINSKSRIHWRSQYDLFGLFLARPERLNPEWPFPARHRVEDKGDQLTGGHLSLVDEGRTFWGLGLRPCLGEGFRGVRYGLESYP